MSKLDTEFKEIVVTHANLEKEIKVRVGAVGGHHFSDTSNCTYLYTISGVFPVKESSEEISKLITNATKEIK